MAEYNLTPARQVVVYGDCWPVVSAVQFVVKAMRPECRCDVADTLPCLLQSL
ncbi:transcriptional regulator, partial [Salmonella enterica subsp. diarizonae]|nr:transcriptional regulator [Salmonella enterica subsp. diarizonae]ECV0000681.1 transcriptional regulator [Salmonella enterica subsp. diarizonae serovar 48:i:z]EGD5375157.1 transcriptional regulator [Salmonella enterica]ECE6626387.1 transcriptional regulator [Salmonella enterica subsp. diarizonae]ECI3670956.1 transcriptional regulator [Salmonella enterica subsp. diarizonae]